jgi:serine/threonine-protein kinase
MIGKTILHYKILAKLGEGGMGVVYKAEDTRLERVVALKFLSSHAIAGEEEKKRFKREAKAAAALNHPNICHIYAIDEADDRLFIAMEFIEGKSLAEMVAGTYGGVPLPLNDAVNYATQIAAGLQAAHEKGITHRDIKSANVMVTDKGVVKIMDFGLAKLGNRSMMTKEGMTLGTAAYMSPEQARGEIVDQRTDIWALGVVLYEMISGRLPFRGEYEQAMIYSILHEEPEPLTALRSNVPIALDGIIAKALAKNPSVRYQHVDEVPADLKAIDSASSSRSRISTMTKTPAGVKTSEGYGFLKSSKLPWALFGIALLIIVFGLVTPWRKPPAQKRPNKTVLTLPSMSLQSTSQNDLMAVSPDGLDMVFVASAGGRSRLYLKRAGSFDIAELEGTVLARAPFFSPDGRWIGYVHPTSKAIYKVLVDGGKPVKVTNYTESPGGVVGATWTPDNTIIFVDDGVLKRIPDSGGEPITLTQKKDANELHLFPHVLPDGKGVLFTMGFVGADLKSYRLAVYRFGDDGYRVIMDENGYNGVFSASGHIIFGRSGDIIAAPFDLENLRITGDPVPVLENVQTNLSSGAMNYAISQSGTIIYATDAGSASDSKRSVLNVDLAGNATDFFALEKNFELARYSPNGKYVAFVIREQNVPNIWIYDMASQSLNQLTFHQESIYKAFWGIAWSPDSKFIAYDAAEEDSVDTIYMKKIDGSGSAEKIFTTTFGEDLNVNDWSSDGNKILCTIWRPFTDFDIFVYSFQDSSLTPYAATEATEAHGSFSPNGLWVAYNTFGDIYVKPLHASSGGIWRISTGGGGRPVWSPDGKKLFYRNENTMYAVDVTTEETFSKGNPRKLFEGNYFLPFGRRFDIHPDGKSFIMIQLPDPASQAQKIFVIQNFSEELKRLAPVKEE